ncbi:MAG: hypothetical protein ACTS1Z_06215 [Parasphingopyxis sp.]|uniref:hypothetical protein n=1 Tax=Parasphingopyxis sp. TaxID=1920299 RepID=UPI003FA1056D
MAFLVSEYNFCFFAAPATGSTAVIVALQEAGIGAFWPAEDIVEDGRRIAPSKHSTLPQLRDAGIAEPVEPAIKVVGVRNMFSWYVAKFLRNRTSRMRNVKNKKSWIYDLPPDERDRYIEKLTRQSEMTFEEFLHDGLDRHDAIDVHEAFHLEMDVYLHQEALAGEFAAFGGAIGLPADIIIKPYNVTGAMPADRTYKDYYTQELVDYLYEKTAPFFARFPEYSFDGYDPARARPLQIERQVPTR